MKVDGERLNYEQASKDKSPVQTCPCCSKVAEFYNVYFSGGLEAFRCSVCGVAFPK